MQIRIALQAQEGNSNMASIEYRIYDNIVRLHKKRGNLRIITIKEKMMKRVSAVVFKIILAIILFVFLPCSCRSYEQMGETAAEGHRRHERNYRIQQQQMMADLDKVLHLDKPSKLTDKRIP